jgi:hypothetical protein
MVMLNEGPANHIRDAAYKYVQRLDKVSSCPVLLASRPAGGFRLRVRIRVKVRVRV